VRKERNRSATSVDTNNVRKEKNRSATSVDTNNVRKERKGKEKISN